MKRQSQVQTWGIDDLTGPDVVSFRVAWGLSVIANFPLLSWIKGVTLVERHGWAGDAHEMLKEFPLGFAFQFVSIRRAHVLTQRRVISRAIPVAWAVVLITPVV